MGSIKRKLNQSACTPIDCDGRPARSIPFPKQTSFDTTFGSYANRGWPIDLYRQSEMSFELFYNPLICISFYNWINLRKRTERNILHRTENMSPRIKVEQQSVHSSFKCGKHRKQRSIGHIAFKCFFRSNKRKFGVLP